MADFLAPRLRDWAGGLVWGGLGLAFALMLVALFITDVRDTRAPAAALTPSSLAALELNPYRELLVDVEGFAVDCEQATFDGERLLAPGLPADGTASVVLVAFEHGSDCREAAPLMRGRFRAKAKAVSPELRGKLGIDEADAITLAIVEPHAVGYWMLLGLAFMGSIGLFGVYTALDTRKQLIARMRRARGEDIDEPAPIAPDDRNAPDPYRPGTKHRLITERITPAPAFLARLRRARTLQAVFAVILLAGALAFSGWMGRSLYQHEHVWATGELAPQATATGEVHRTALILARTRLDVTFVDHGGRLHRESISNLSLIVTGDDSVRPVVRYLPDAPERFAVSWLHEQLWGSIALLLLVGGGLLAAAIAVWRSARGDRRPEQAAAVFDDPREALLQLISRTPQIVNGQETGVTYHFDIPDSSRSYSHFVPAKQPAPLFLDEGQTIALALYNPADPSYLLLLGEDLGELHDPAFSAEQLRGRYRAGA